VSGRVRGRIGALAVMIVGTVLFVLGMGQQSAFASMTVHVSSGSLDQSNSCGGDTTATGAHFVINQIAQADAPLTITVTLSDGSTVTGVRVANNASESGYNAVFAAGLTVTDATAVVPDGWTGQFVLSNYICGATPPPTTPPPTTSSAPPTTSSSTASVAASTAVVTQTVAIEATSAAAPIPAAVAAGHHPTSSTPLELGAALMAAGVGGLLFGLRPGRRGSRV
jgi:hypothetical protein